MIWVVIWAIKSAFTTLVGGGPENVAYKPLAIRVQKGTTELEDGGGIDVLDVQAIGHIPGPAVTTNIEFVFHLFDATENEAEPVLCAIEFMQEKDSRVFEIRNGGHQIGNDSYLADWETLISIPSDFLQFPKRGQRDVICQLSVVNEADPPNFMYGFVVGDEGTSYGAIETKFTFEFDDFGYHEEAVNRSRVEELSIELGMHVAAADGSLEKSEGDVIKEWVKRIIGSTPEDLVADEKERLNAAIARAYEKASKSATSLSEIAAEFNEIGSIQEKYDALELALDVMSADGVADEAEMRELDKIVEALELDSATYRSMREQHLTQGIDIDAVTSDLDDLIGIHQTMSKDEIRSHLAGEFRKWNSRVTHKDEKIRAHAQHMLNLIGEARKKHLSEA